MLVIATPWKKFKALRPEHLRQDRRRPVIRLVAHAAPGGFRAVAEYIACGRGPSAMGSGQRVYAAEAGHPIKVSK